MSTEADKAVVTGFVQEVQNGHNPDAIDKFLSPDHVDHSGMLPPEQTDRGVRRGRRCSSRCC